ncbi:hypothetical protein O5541_02645 [Escherichia coli]|nr:hypothetical protein [Escherichia coli]
MGSPSVFCRKTTLALAVALSFAWQAPVFAHGGEAHMVPMDKTLKEFGADVQWDDYAQLFTLIKDGAYVKVSLVRKQQLLMVSLWHSQVPVVMKKTIKPGFLTPLLTMFSSPGWIKPFRLKAPHRRMR